uniref:Ovule protein n=1 Tax=Acrobeloides nanus TaxID=290746 RepID=A0A914D9A0_9BILA
MNTTFSPPIPCAPNFKTKVYNVPRTTQSNAPAEIQSAFSPRSPTHTVAAPTTPKIYHHRQGIQNKSNQVFLTN